MKKIFITIAFTLLSVSLFPQETNTNNNRTRLAAKTDITIEGYRNINIGMGKSEVIDIIKKDPLIMLENKYYNQSIDLITEETKNVVVIVPNKYFKNGYFIFKDDKLYSIIISFRDNQADFLELLQSLNKKYKKGSFINAGTVSWESSNIKLTLERPATIKYFLIEDKENIDNRENASNDSTLRQSLFDGL